MSIDDQSSFGLTGQETERKATMPRRERLRLSALRFRIAELERHLAHEFATQGTAPLIQELQQLLSDQEALLSRYADPGPNQRR